VILDDPIGTERLFLRTLSSVDVVPHYLAWMSDPDILRYLEVRFSAPQTRAALTKYVTRTNDSDNELLLGIFLRDSQRHVGNIKVGPICRNHSRADVGFIIGDRTAWGKGYATEAISAVAKFALAELKLVKVCAGCYATNQGSVRALEKAGFVQEGKLCGYWSIDGRREDGLLFGLSNRVAAT
jgi:ribosomal-protein-alanine N-acetyltransferase